MIRALITGAKGFIGKNLDIALRRLPNVTVDHLISSDSLSALNSKVAEADVIFHLAGLNRPIEESDFQRVNVDVTRTIAESIQSNPNKPQTILFSSSIQATLDSPYGRSKKDAEVLLASLAELKAKRIKIYRLPNVFGKWSRPNYNSAVATFCYNIARGLPITITSPGRELELVYIDDVIQEWIKQLDGSESKELFGRVEPVLHCTVDELARRIESIRDMRESLHVPDMRDRLNFALHATYTSFLDESDLARSVRLRTDERGWLFELTKSQSFGQVFVSTTKPGITRGNHYHDSKIERFCLVKGKGLIRFRKTNSEHVIEYPVDDSNIKIVDIVPGYTHSIENVGETDMIVLFWANEIFDPNVADTHFEEVLR